MDDFFSHGIPSLIRLPSYDIFWADPGKWSCLAGGWEKTVEAFASEQVLPRMENKTVVGVFVGDTICGYNSSCM